MLTLVLKYTKGFKEGFFDFPDDSHNTFVQSSQTKYNNLTNTINLLDPAVPVTPDGATAFKLALGGIATRPTPNTYQLQPKSEFTIPTDLPDTFKKAKFCQSKPPTCDAFDDPTFAAECGMSFDINGLAAGGEPHVGGLFISDDDRKKQTDAAANVLATESAPYDPYKVYQPTLGKAKPGTFALTKDQCTIVKEKVDCATKQTFNSPNCTQCYTSQNFARVGPETGRIPFTINFFGAGTITIAPTNNSSCAAWTEDDLARIANGEDQGNVCQSVPGREFDGTMGKIPQCGGCWCCWAPFFINEAILDKNNPITLNLPGNSEGQSFNITVGPADGVSIPFLAGYVEGQTPRGTYRLDIFSIISADLQTNSKPRLNGVLTINGFRCLSMVPGAGQAQMILSSLVPFSFLSMYDGDAMTCDNGPIITQAASATFLESDPCFGKANQPGNYKLECLQTRWVELGGTPQGTGYPSNQAAANLLQIDGNGNPLDIDSIVNNLAPAMISAQTGKNANGKDMSLADWNNVSMWATGTPINTPCDGPNGTTGPLSQECLSYLYMNQGINSHIGATYTLQSSQIASMLGQNTQNTYCQPGAPLDPSTPTGLQYGQSLGGINAVKQSYDQINRLANDNTQLNSARADAVNRCYGVKLDLESTADRCSGLCPTSMTSQNGMFVLVTQTDGNLVQYNTSSGGSTWASGTAGNGTPPFSLVMQDDGNLVLYDSRGNVNWASGTNGQGVPPYTLVNQSDMNIVIYDGNGNPTWASI